MSAALRIDRLVWFLRFAPSRSIGQKWVEAGHFRHNGKRVEKANTLVAAGDLLVLPLRAGPIAIRIIAIPDRRGPAAEAQACYQRLDAAESTP